MKNYLLSMYDQLFNKPVDPDIKLITQLTRIATREANAIDDLFIKHEIDARVDRRNVEVSDTGGFIRYKILNGSRVSKLTSLQDDLSQVISELRNDDVTVKIRKPRIIIEILYPLERRILAWEDAPIDKLKKFQAICGMNYDNIQVAPVILDWHDPNTSNVLVAGETGSGKTNGLLEIVLSLASNTPSSEAHFIILDPKFSPSIRALSELPHVIVYNETSDCALALSQVKEEVNRRKRQPDKRKLFLIVEEISELMLEVGDNKEKQNLFDLLRSIAQIGREQGIHVIACTQKPVTEVVDTVFRANLPNRLAYKVGTVKESEVATGQTEVDCSRLPGRGAAYFVRNGRAQRIQSHYIDPDELYNIIDSIAMNDKGSPYRLGQVAVINNNLPDGITQSQIDNVLSAFSLEDIFDNDGNIKRGIKAKVIRQLFGSSAATGGANDQTANKILDYIVKNPV